MNIKALSITEAASRTGINRQSIIRLIDEGKVDGNRIGRKWFVSEESLYAWLHRSKPQPQTETKAFPEIEEDIFA